MTHVYIRYAAALLMEEYALSDERDISSFKIVKKALQDGLDSFSVKPVNDFIGKNEVLYRFTSDRNKASDYVFLAPNSITAGKQASNLLKKLREICSMEDDDLTKVNQKLSKAEAPVASEFSKFIESGEKREWSRVTELSRCLALITTTTPLKPCLQYETGLGKDKTSSNVCLIPDLELPQLIDFIKLFKRIRIQKLDSSLMVGKVKCKDAKKNEYVPKRPNLFKGNFPNAPHSGALGAIALLGAIGEMTKEKDVSALAHSVLNSLRECNFYSIEYEKTNVFSFNHYIIDLAENGKLRTIVDGMYRVVLYKYGNRMNVDLVDERLNQKNEKQEDLKGNIMEYQRFDLFASRFLQLFNRPAFRDFLAFRAEYPNEIKLLLNIYFNKMEKIKEEIVASAKALGRWLNKTAYISAINDVQNKNWDDKNKAKAKTLVELESSIFSAKSGDSLIAHTITRAGRLSGMDAPAEASLFIEKAVNGELPLEQAKNLLIAFSRLKYKKDDAEDQVDSSTEEPQVGNVFEEKEDLSNI